MQPQTCWLPVPPLQDDDENYERGSAGNGEEAHSGRYIRYIYDAEGPSDAKLPPCRWDAGCVIRAVVGRPFLHHDLWCSALHCNMWAATCRQDASFGGLVAGGAPISHRRRMVHCMTAGGSASEGSSGSSDDDADGSSGSGDAEEDLPERRRTRKQVRARLRAPCNEPSRFSPPAVMHPHAWLSHACTKSFVRHACVHGGVTPCATLAATVL